MARLESRPQFTTVLQIASYKDDAADTIVPRLMAMGADLARVHILREVCDADGRRGFDAKRDGVTLLAETGRIGDLRLMIIDPAVVALGAFDSHKNVETRRALQPLAELAQSSGAAVLGVSHFTKGTADAIRWSASLGPSRSAPRLGSWSVPHERTMSRAWNAAFCAASSRI
jgi:hypothetical protein